MPARLSALAAAALTVLAAVPAGPAAAYRADRADTVVAVPADGSAAPTPFVTSRGARYRLTVTGTYASDRIGGLADCGYRDTNAALTGQIWTAAAGLLIDGAAAACGAYDATHTYQLSVTGTGARLTFAIAADPTGHADNAGALMVVVETALDVDAECRWTATPVPGGTYVVLYTLVAEAHQTGTAAAGTTTWVRCRGDLEYDFEELVAAGAADGPAVVAVDEYGTFLQQSQRVTTCLEAGVDDAAGNPLLHRTWACS